MILRTICGVLAIGLLLIGALAVAQQSGSTATALEQWQRAGIDDYMYSYRKYCDCNKDEPPTTVVRVIDGSIERVHHLHDDSSREVPAREGSLDLYWTIDDLFAKLEIAVTAGAVVRADFDAADGHPVRIFIDYDTEFAGDETDLRDIALERL